MVTVDDGDDTSTANVTVNLLNQASIAGTVFINLYAANELGIDGVMIALLAADGTLLTTATTSVGGF